MFGRLAPTLLDQGYARPIPVRAGAKSPILSRWDRYNRRAPSRGEVGVWAKQYPEASIGYAAGGDVVALDLDHLDPELAFLVRSIADEILGESPCIRIGQAPKSLRLYRRGDGEIVTRRFLRASVEVYGSSGQWLMFGMHPVTGRPYEWPEEGPLDVHADDLPPLHAEALQRFIAAISPTMPERVRGASLGDGSTAEVMAFHAEQPSGTTLAESCRRMMKVATLRHPTMLAVTLVLLQTGYDEERIIAEIGDAYLSRFEPREIKERWGKLRGYPQPAALGGAVAGGDHLLPQAGRRMSGTDTIRATLGVDTEWVSPVDEGDTPERVSISRRERWNDLLAYSACLRIGDLELPAIWQISDPETTDYRKRKTFRQVLTEVLGEAVGRGMIGHEVKTIHLSLVFHFSPADIFAFRARNPREHLVARCENIRGHYATIGLPHRLPRLPLRLAHRSIMVRLSVRDTALLAPAGYRSLGALGEAIGLEKLALPPGAIEDMREFRRADPELFTEYAVRDAVITARYYDQVRDFAAEALGLEDVEPVTAAGLATRAFLADLHGRQVDPQALRGRRGRGVRAAELPGTGPIRYLASRAFHGGANVGGWYGPSPAGMPVFDSDLKSAYPTAQATIRSPDWPNARMSANLLELAQCGERGMTFAEVRFTFPAGTRYPCLPVRLPAPDHALVFPLAGVSFATGPELLQARLMGASLEVLNGAIIPAKNDARPFVPFVGRMLANRARFKAEDLILFERLSKEMANSVYGKTAQGLTGKRGYSIQANGYIDTPVSAITCAAVAAWTTGFIRAAIGELLSRLPADAVAFNWVTDGVCSSVPTAELDASGPVMTAYAEARRCIETEILGRRIDDVELLETKHSARRVLAGATRLCLTIDGDRDRPPISAKAGNRLTDLDYRRVRAMIEEAAELPSEERTRRLLEAQWLENDLMLAAMRDRTARTTLRRKVPEGLVAQYRRQLAGGVADLQWVKAEVRMAGDYDHKRRLVEPVESGWHGFASWATEPWPTAEDAIRARALQKARRKGRGKVLKTMADATDWLDACRAAGLYFHVGGNWIEIDDGDKELLRWAVANSRFGWPPFPRPGITEPGGWSTPYALEALAELGAGISRRTLFRLKGKLAPTIGDVAKIARAASISLSKTAAE